MKITTDTLQKINCFTTGGLCTAFFLSLINISARAYCAGITVKDTALGIPRVMITLTPEGTIALAVSLGTVLFMGTIALITNTLIIIREKQAAEHDEA